MQLLIGSGARRNKILYVTEKPGSDQWDGLVTLDSSDRHKPDVVHDLEALPLPFNDNTADEIHAYCVLEHVGKQGDWKFFFDQWSDFWRILKPGGLFFGICPLPNSPWAWGDPSHTRIISVESFTFLSQKSYQLQVGNGPMTDFRDYYKADFELANAQVLDGQQIFCLKAIK